MRASIVRVSKIVHKLTLTIWIFEYNIEEEDEGFYSEGFEDSPQADTDHMDIRV